MNSVGARLGIALTAGVLVGGLAPRVVGPKDHAAGAPFTYVPPAGFVESEEAEKGALVSHVASGGKVWIRPSLDVLAGGYTPNVSLVRTSKTAPVEEAELAVLARGMPQMFAAQGTTWTENRHGMHRRPDGARVGFLEGSAHAGPGTEPHRVLQLAFPVDDGAAIVTASYPEAGADVEARAFEASMDAAKGVAFRAPEPSRNQYLGWGFGAGAFAFVVATFLGSREAARAKTSAA